MSRIKHDFLVEVLAVYQMVKKLTMTQITKLNIIPNQQKDVIIISRRSQLLKKLLSARIDLSSFKMKCKQEGLDFVSYNDNVIDQDQSSIYYKLMFTIINRVFEHFVAFISDTDYMNLSFCSLQYWFKLQSHIGVVHFDVSAKSNQRIKLDQLQYYDRLRSITLNINTKIKLSKAISRRDHISNLCIQNAPVFTKWDTTITNDKLACSQLFHDCLYQYNGLLFGLSCIRQLTLQNIYYIKMEDLFWIFNNVCCIEEVTFIFCGLKEVNNKEIDIDNDNIFSRFTDIFQEEKKQQQQQQQGLKIFSALNKLVIKGCCWSILYFMCWIIKVNKHKHDVTLHLSDNDQYEHFYSKSCYIENGEYYKFINFINIKSLSIKYYSHQIVGCIVQKCQTIKDLTIDFGEWLQEVDQNKQMELISKIHYQLISADNGLTSLTLFVQGIKNLKSICDYFQENKNGYKPVVGEDLSIKIEIEVMESRDRIYDNEFIEKLKNILEMYDVIYPGNQFEYWMKFDFTEMLFRLESDDDLDEMNMAEEEIKQFGKEMQRFIEDTMHLKGDIYSIGDNIVVINGY